MEQRWLGNSNIRIAPLVFGGNVFGWTVDQARSFELLDAMVDMGLNMLDTADVYSAWVHGNRGGESETIIGNWLQKSGKRDQVLIASKVGMPMGHGRKGLGRDYIIGSAEDSLKRLQTDHIDVYYAHQDAPDVPLEETLEAFQQLIRDGKICSIAASNYTPSRLATALDTARKNGLPEFIAHQPEYNLYDRDGYEGDLEKICRESGLGVVSYFSLASGFLSGKYRNRQDLEKSGRGAAFLEKYLNPRGLRILAAQEKVAQHHQVTPAAIALAWIPRRPGVTAPIASATSTEQLQQLVAAASLQLSDSDMQLLNCASEKQS